LARVRPQWGGQAARSEAHDARGPDAEIQDCEAAKACLRCDRIFGISSFVKDLHRIGDLWYTLSNKAGSPGEMKYGCQA